MAPTADPDEQTEFDEPIKFQWQGKLARRVAERQLEYAGKWDPENETWSEDEDADPTPRLMYRVTTRHKTLVEIRTVEEALAFYKTMNHYSDGAGRHGITWMNGPMEKSARRVRTRARDGLVKRGYDIVRDGLGFAEDVTEIDND